MFIETNNNTISDYCQCVNAFVIGNTDTYSGVMSNLRDNLYKAMQAKGWNAYHLADASGVPQSTITRFLNGTHGDPRSSTIQNLAKALELTESELRGFSEPANDRITRICQTISKLPDNQILSLELFINSLVEPASQPASQPASSRAEQSRAEQSRAEQSKTEQRIIDNLSYKMEELSNDLSATIAESRQLIKQKIDDTTTKPKKFLDIRKKEGTHYTFIDRRKDKNKH